MDFRVLLLLLLTTLFLAFGLLVYFSGRRSVVNRVYCIFIANMTLWAFSLAMFYGSEGSATSMFWSKVVYLAGSVIPAAFLHFSFVFPIGSFRPWQLAIYLPNVILFFLYFFTPWILRGVDYFDGAKGFLYGPCRILWDLQFDTTFSLGFYRLFRSYQRSMGVMKMRLRYIVLGTFVGLILAGATNVIMPWFNRFQFLWLGPLLTLTWLGSIVYAITRYQLMDIRVAVARGTIFILLHTLAIGVPFFIALSGEAWLKSFIGEKWWMVPFGLLAVLSSLVPALYSVLQAHAEARIFKAERQYQAALRTMSQELIGFTDVKSLRSFVGRYVGEQMGLTSADLFVQGNGFEAPQPAANDHLPTGVKEALQRWITSPSRTEAHILAEQLGAGRPDMELRVLRTWMARFGVSALVPGYLRGELVTCLVLGHKRTGAIFSPEDFEVLEAMARQSALVIKNLGLLDEVHTQHRLAEFGELMNAINHEFNNIFVIISGTLQMLVENPSNPALRQELAGLQDEILRGQYIIRSASAYRKKHRSPVEAWTLTTVIETALTQAQQDAFAGARPQVTITTSVPQDVELSGRATIPELVINALRCLGWACDSKPGTLRVEVVSDPPMVQLRFAMTGGEDLRAVIEKEGALAPEPGRHGGLYYFLVKLIVADHQGSLMIESTPGGGTTLVVRLPKEQIAAAPAHSGLASQGSFQ